MGKQCLLRANTKRGERIGAGAETEGREVRPQTDEMTRHWRWLSWFPFTMEDNFLRRISSAMIPDIIRTTDQMTGLVPVSAL